MNSKATTTSGGLFGEALATARPVLVSACLLGVACRYDGATRRSAYVLRALDGIAVLPVCPELVAGLGVPRAPFQPLHVDMARIIADQRGLVDATGRDVTAPVVAACRQLTETAVAAGVRRAFLKDGSPCCGVSRISVGRWPVTRRVSGHGVLTELLRRHGIEVASEASPQSSTPPEVHSYE